MKFYSKVLQGLDRILRFDGQISSLDRMDVAGEIQPVYDVGRMAELASIVTAPGAAGFFSLDQDNVHAAGGETVQSTIDPYGTIDATWGRPGERWIWLMKYAGSGTTASIGLNSQATLTVGIRALGNALTSRDFLLAWYGQSSAISMTTALSLPSGMLPTMAFSPGVDLPFPLPPNSVVTWRTVATGAAPGTIRIAMLCWIGPFGVYPPGLM